MFFATASADPVSIGRPGIGLAPQRRAALHLSDWRVARTDSRTQSPRFSPYVPGIALALDRRSPKPVISSPIMTTPTIPCVARNNSAGTGRRVIGGSDVDDGFGAPGGGRGPSQGRRRVRHFPDRLPAGTGTLARPDLPRADLAGRLLPDSCQMGGCRAECGRSRLPVLPLDEVALTAPQRSVLFEKPGSKPADWHIQPAQVVDWAYSY